MRSYAAGLAAGGTDNGPAGLRPDYHPNYYAAFVLDPEGNNVEVVWREPPAARSAAPAAGKSAKARAAKKPPAKASKEPPAKANKTNNKKKR